MQTVNDFTKEFSHALRAQDGDKLASLLTLHSANFGPKFESAATRVGQMLPNVSAPMKEVGVSHVIAAGHAASGQLDKAFAGQLDLMRAMRKQLGGKDRGRWLLQPLAVITRELRELAYGADNSTGNSDCTESALAEIRQIFSVCNADRAELQNSLKHGMLMLTSNILSISFRLNNFANIKSLCDIVEGDRMAPLFSDRVNGFSLASLVTFKYYLGRKALFEANYTKANDNLSYAFEHCYGESVHNKRLILVYLTPVKLRLGQIPTAHLLKKYNLSQFVGIAEAVRSGDLKLLHEQLKEHQMFFVRWGIFMTLEKLRFLAYRNLFKRVYTIVLARDGKSHIPIQDLQTALNSLQERQIDLDETECIVANLIHKKYIKGYISHTQRKLVVSNKNPFPALQQVPAF